jgi:hypothetical protein
MLGALTRAARLTRRAPRRALSAPPFSMPPADAWDPSAFARLPPVAVTDADLARLARLSLLRLPDAGAERERLRAGVSAVLTAARLLRDEAGGGGGGGGGSSASASASAPLDAALASLSEAELDAAAEARWAELRDDDVAEGGEDVASAAAVRDGPFFVAPGPARGSDE